MFNINIFNFNVEVGTLTKISESSSEETPSAFGQMLILSPLNCPGASAMIFGTTETRKHLLIEPRSLTMPQDVLKLAIAYISLAKRLFTPTESHERY
jgi:hypothetical protein